MNYSEVKELLTAGFTHDEIISMLNPQNNAQAPAPDPEPNPEPEQEQEQAVENPEQPAQPEQLTDDKFNQLNSTMEKLIKTIQTSNLQSNFVDTVKGVSLEKEVDDIMKSIIRPEKEAK